MKLFVGSTRTIQENTKGGQMSSAKLYAMAAAQVALPWSVPCWLIGSGMYYLGEGRKNDSTGEGYLYQVLFAPVCLPLILAISCDIID
jgi:hypothetical protein